MKYPQEFIVAVKAEFPGDEEILNALEQGREMAGRYLDESRGMGMGPEDIIKAFAEGREQEVRAAAEKAVRREKLYNMWCDIYHKGTR